MKKITAFLSLLLLSIIISCSGDGSSGPLPTLFANGIGMVPRSYTDMNTYGAGTTFTPANPTDPQSKNHRLFKIMSDEHQQLFLEILYQSASINGTYDVSHLATNPNYGICLFGLPNNWPAVAFGGLAPDYAYGTVTITDMSPMLSNEQPKKFKLVFNNVILKAHNDPQITQTITGYIETNFMPVF